MSEFAAIDFSKPGPLSFAHPAFAPRVENATLSRPDASFAVMEGGVVRACFSLWWAKTPEVAVRMSACIGHLYAEDDVWGRTALARAEQILRERGHTGPILAPMDGSTWFSYRVTLDTGDSPPFFLERFSAPFWPKVLAEAGFTVTACYRSSLTTNLGYADRAAEVWADKIGGSALTIRSFDPARAQDDLRALYDLSLGSFARNLFYTPIAEADFMAAYAPVLPVVVPDFVLMAYDGDVLAGFVFAVPDYAQKQRDEEMDTLIIKTLAVRPGRAYAGLGSYLAWQVHGRAAAAGLKRAIHAYIFDGNVSRVISDKSATSIRTYGLYAKA